MRTVLFILCGLILYAYVGYPALLWLVSRLFPRRHAIDEAHEPTVTILVPAFNEQRVIGGKIENLLSLGYPRANVQIIVASASDDRADHLVQRDAPAHPRTILLPSTTTRGTLDT